MSQKSISPLVNDAYLKLEPYVPGRPGDAERQALVARAINLAANENPRGASPKALLAMQRAMVEVHRYPDGSGRLVKERIAAHLGVDANQLVLGNGSGEIIEMVARGCIRPGEEALCAKPSFLLFRLAPEALGAPVVEVPLLPDFRYDLDGMLAAVTERTKLLFIANPNNPTGTYVPRLELEAFLDRVPAHVIVVIDEAYFEYATAKDYPNALTYLPRRERLVVMRTFSKCYGLAAARLGYGVTTPELADYLNRAREPFNVNALVQAAAIAALDDQAHVAESQRMNRSETGRLEIALRSRGFRVTESQGNFVLIDVGRDATACTAALLEEGVLARSMASYGLFTFLRITIGTPADNDVFLHAIDRVFGR